MSFFHTLELISTVPRLLAPACGQCKLFKGCNSPKMEPTGDGKRKVLIVGEAPGADEDRRGVQFVGKAGRYLEECLQEIGVNLRKDCWLTNALICRPPGNEIKDNKQVDYCRPNLIKTIDRLKPDVVILLGAMAVESLLPHVWGPAKGGIGRWAGWRAPSHTINAYVCPTWHPSHLLRMESPALKLHFVEHLRQAFALKGKPWQEVPDYNKEVRLLYERDKIVSFLERIDEGTIAFDYETSTLKPDSDKSRIVCCSVCWNGNKTVSFPLLPGVQQALCDLLTNPEVNKIAQNMKYEDRWTRRVLGVQVRSWRWDTMLASHLLDCRRGITGLKFQSFVQLGQPKYDSHIEPYLKENDSGNKENQIDQIPLDQLLLYCGLDSLLTYKIAVKQMKEMNLNHHH